MAVRKEVREFYEDTKEVFKLICENNGVSFDLYWNRGFAHVFDICKDEFNYAIRRMSIPDINKKAVYVSAITNSALRTFNKVVALIN
jgi:hypothetical protein